MAKKKKVFNWDGYNKSLVRRYKLSVLDSAKRCKFLPEEPSMLSFPGAKARLEKALVKRGIVSPENIIAVQTYKRRGSWNGGEVLKKLFSAREKYLPEMFIWPHDFTKFVDCYKGRYSAIPNFVGGKGAIRKPAWLRRPTLRQEIERFVGLAALPFDILDIDICGVFGEEIAKDISGLMRSQKFADQGYFFFTHQKGRDGRKGKLHEFIQDYFGSCYYFDMKDMDEFGIETDGPDSYFYIRYYLVPIFFICEAFEAGYQLDLECMLEYRDLNPQTRSGNYMLQWVFKFKKLYGLPHSKEYLEEKIDEVIDKVKTIAEDEDEKGYKYYLLPDYE